MKRSLLCRIIWENKDDTRLPEMDDLIVDLAKRDIEYISSHNEDVPIIILKEKQ